MKIKTYHCPNCHKIYSVDLIMDERYCPNIEQCGNEQTVNLLDYATYFFKIQVFNKDTVHINKPVLTVQVPTDKTTWVSVDGTNRIVAIESELNHVWEYQGVFGGEYRFIYPCSQLTKPDLIDFLTIINVQLIDNAILEINKIQKQINDNKLNVNDLSKQAAKLLS